jgi:hypothetical protein
MMRMRPTHPPSQRISPYVTAGVEERRRDSARFSLRISPRVNTPMRWLEPLPVAPQGQPRTPMAQPRRKRVVATRGTCSSLQP